MTSGVIEPAIDAAPRKRLPRRRVRTPTVLQMEAVECGAAALAIVLGHYGRVVPLEELRVRCGVSRDGSKASNMVKAARAYGLEGKGFRREIGDVLAMAFPVIVFWNFNHFVVLEGTAGDRIYLNDPAEGPRVVSYDEFDRAYTGIVLSFVPGPGFEKAGRPPSLAAAIRVRARGSETALLFAALAGLGLIVPGILLPAFTQVFVDKILVARLGWWFAPLLVAMALTAIVRGALTWLQQYYLLRLQTKLSLASSSSFMWHVLRLPIEFYTQRYGGEIAWRVWLNDGVSAFVAGRLASAAIDAVMVVFFAALMFAYDWTLTLIGLAAIVLLCSANVAVSRRRVDANRRLGVEQGKANGALLGALANIETVKASGLEGDVFSRWAGYQTKYANAHQELATTTQLFLALPPLVVAATNIAVLAIGARHVITGRLSMGQLVAFQTLMASFLAPVTNLVQLGSTLQEMEGNMNRIDDVLRYPIDPSAAPDDEEVNPSRQLTGALELRGVAFGYLRLEPPLVEDVSAALGPGGRVALVGASGSGKSTIAKHVTGLYEPWAGDVRFDGAPRADAPRRALTNSIAMVNQDITLFAGTVRENVTLWDSTIPESQLVQACKDACIHDDISARPGGYDSRVEEGGVNFSGGQRQRLEIARALVGNPRILVLDEATSALDALTEQQVDGNLRRRGCTCVIIAHRLSTVRDADEILVLDRGRVVERGSHPHLVALGGAYARLIEHT